MDETETFEHDRRRRDGDDERQRYDRRSSDAGARKRHNQTIAASTILATAIITAFAALFVLVGKKGIVAVIGDAMGDEISKQVTHQVAPLGAGLKAIIQQNIERLRRRIGVLKFKERAGAITADESSELTELGIELDGQRTALDAIVSSERAADK